MNRKTEINTLIAQRPFLLDGATGTVLQEGGMPRGVCPEQWCIDNPATLTRLQSAYIESGADVVSTFTFGANGAKLAEYGITDVETINRELVRITRAAVGEKALVAGDISSTGRFVEPFGDLAFDEAVAIFKRQAQALLDAGVDLFIIETMIDIQEARAALIAIREITDLFTIVTMTYEPGGVTLNGTDAVSALITLQSLGADAVGCNCSTGPEQMLELIRAMKPHATVPLVAKPNAGLPAIVEGRTVFEMRAPDFGGFGPVFVEAGVNILGGCCGTTPEHIKALKDAVTGLTCEPPRITSLGALSSARGHVIFTPQSPLMVVGERINPTGKKALQAELKEGSLSMVRQFAREQELAGANLLDVNMGAPGVDETRLLREAISLLARTTPLPLVIDSSRVDAIEQALRLYPGRALINSISGEHAKLEALLPLAKRYGAMFILLPLTENGIPKDAATRCGIIVRVVTLAKALGFTLADMIVDALTMTVSADQAAAKETLDTIAWCARELGLKTIVGLSNISFGLPERRWINAGFLAMAVGRGLSAAILNPGAEELMAIKFASDVLNGHDQGAKTYIARFGQNAAAPPAPAGTAPASIEQHLHTAVLEGARDEITGLIEQALKTGLTADVLVNTIMIPAIRQVGELYERKVYFLPQLIASAEAMRKGFTLLAPLLADQAGIGARGVILLATVKGDIHDIGKNIVGLMLTNAGFTVIDLGKDVGASEIIAAAREHQPSLIGLSALMTTTMTSMPEIIAQARQAGIACPFMAGGAVLTASYAQEIGAHYASDGVGAVNLAEKLLNA